MKDLAEIPVQYCARCGLEMGYKLVDRGFDIKSGKLTYNIVYTCRDRRHFWDGHSKFKTDQHGSTYAFEI